MDKPGVSLPWRLWCNPRHARRPRRPRVLLLLGFALFWPRYTRLRRAAFIREAALPRGLFEKLRASIRSSAPRTANWWRMGCGSSSWRT